MGAAGLSFGHLLIVLVVIVLVFGTKKLRNVGGDLGAALRDFKAALGSDADVSADSKSATVPGAGAAGAPAQPGAAPAGHDGTGTGQSHG